jgi:hypothetical protein
LKRINKRPGWIALLSLALTQLSFVQADSMEKGLYFHSFLVDKDSRTGLNLTPEKPLSLSGGFTLTFDFKIRPEHDIVTTQVLQKRKKCWKRKKYLPLRRGRNDTHTSFGI